MTNPAFLQDTDIQYLLREFDALGDEGYANYRRSQINLQDYADRRPNEIEEWLRTRHPDKYAIYLEYGIPLRRRRADQPSSFWNLVSDNQKPHEESC